MPTRFPIPAPRPLLTAALAFAAALALAIGGCAPGGPGQAQAPEGGGPPQAAETAPAPPAQPAPAPAPQARTLADGLPSGGGVTLEDYAARRAREQFSDAADIYAPPPASLAGSLVTHLSMDRRGIILATGVADYARTRNGLALLTGDGEIAVLDGAPCPSLILPPERSPERLLWGGGPRFLAVIHDPGRRLMLFDRDQCGSVDDQQLRGTPLVAAAARARAAFVVINDAHRGWLYAPGREPRLVAQMRYTPLAAAFSPDATALVVVDAGGWLSLWPLDGGGANRMLVPGGPFARASFDGPLLRLETPDGEAMAWDLTARKFLAPAAREALELREGVLTLREARKSPVRRTSFAPPGLAAFRSRASGDLRVEDIDGTTRFYSGRDGRPLPAPEPDPVDWTPLDLGPGYDFTADGRAFTLADRIAVDGPLSLYCRHTPDGVFHLWWQPGGGPGEVALPRGMLPARDGLAAGEEPRLVPLRPTAGNEPRP